MPPKSPAGSATRHHPRGALTSFRPTHPHHVRRSRRSVNKSTHIQSTLMKHVERAQALELRRQGMTYRYVIEQLGVTKSTLWRWLKQEGLVDGQSQHYTERRLFAQRKAAETVRRLRLERTDRIFSKARQEISRLSSDELRLVGAALYWAEGAKQKELRRRVSAQAALSNSDPRVLCVFIRFLQTCCHVAVSELSFRIYIHETADASQARAYWFQQLGLAALQTAPITWKRHKPTTSRTNVGATYHGLLRVVVRRSTDLNRQIEGWIQGICAAIGE